MNTSPIVRERELYATSGIARKNQRAGYPISIASVCATNSSDRWPSREENTYEVLEIFMILTVYLCGDLKFRDRITFLLMRNPRRRRVLLFF